MDPGNDLLLVSAVVRDVDAIGRGLVAAEHVPAGRVVAVFGGRAVTSDEFDELSDDDQAHSVQVHDDVYLVPGEPASPAALINHSCDPSCRLDGQIVLVAARDLVPGDHITYDYATSDGSPYDEFECECRTARCRLKVTGDDWMRPELQERYDGWFSPYLARRIEALRSAERDPSGGLVIPTSSR